MEQGIGHRKAGKELGSVRRERVYFQRWVLLGLFVAGVIGVVAGVSGGQAGAVFEAWMYWGFVIPLVVSAGMLGLLLTMPFARRGYFAGSPWPEVYRLVVGTAIGLGVYGLGMLGLGSAHGLLPPGVPAIMEVVGGIAGLGETRVFFRRFEWGRMKGKVGRGEWMILLGAVPVGIMLIAMTFPPGSLWVSEGRGYDVAEYHLELPREYGAVNSTAPVGHNVYSYLPANMEMLYLMLMQTGKWVLQDKSGDAYLWGVFPAQFLHVVMMLLAAMGVGLAPVRMGTSARIVAVLVVLAIPWTVVTGSLAYDEGGMMLCGGLAMGLALGCGKDAGNRVGSRAEFGEGLLIGILLGLAVGSKVTAGIAFAVPVAGVWLLRGRWKGVIVATVVALVLYSPWAVRAAIYSGGNPVFPLASTVLPRDGWSAEQAARFARGHSAGADERTVTGHFVALGKELFLSPEWSVSWSSVYRWVGDAEPAEAMWWKHLGVLWMVMPVVGVCLLARRKLRGETGMILGVMLVQVLGWMVLTHLQSRFLLPVVVPLAWVVGMSVESAGAEGMVGGLRVLIRTVVGCQVICAVFLLLPEVGLLGGMQHVGGVRAQPPPAPIGELFSREVNIAAIVEQNVERQEPPMGKILLVGNSAPLFWQGDIVCGTVFDRNLLGDALRRGGEEGAARWLKEEGFNYVVVDWSEVYRLRETYGFDDAITPGAIEGLMQWGIRDNEMARELGLTILQVKATGK